MAERIIDLLEAIQVDPNDGYFVPMTLGLQQGVLQPVVQKQSVGKFRQDVVLCLKGEPVIKLPVFDGHCCELGCAFELCHALRVQRLGLAPIGGQRPNQFARPGKQRSPPTVLNPVSDRKLPATFRQRIYPAGVHHHRFTGVSLGAGGSQAALRREGFQKTAKIWRQTGSHDHLDPINQSLASSIAASIRLRSETPRDRGCR